MQNLDYYPPTDYYPGFELAGSEAQPQYYTEAYYGERASVSHKRKADRACDHCRKRKTKCDGPSMKDHICTNCLQNRQTCSYVETSKPRGPPKAYISALEDRMEKMEALLMRLRPDADLSTTLGPPVVRNSWKEKDPATEKPSATLQASSKKPSLPAKAMMTLSSPPPAHPAIIKKADTAKGGNSSDVDSDSQGSDLISSEDDIGELSLVSGVKRLTMHGLQPTDDERGAVVDHQLRYHGKSSQYKLIGATRRLKEAYAEEVRQLHPNADVASDAASVASSSAYSQYSSAREVYWQTPQWELEWEGAHISSPTALPRIENPPDDLAVSLIDSFFEHVNVQWPLLHRPTFERQRKQGLHDRDVWFACLCQCVFAVASRWSDDPRVLPESDKGIEEQGNSEHKRWHKAGWKFFETAVEVHQARRSIVIPVGLFEVQTLALLSMYLNGSEYEAASWLYVSVGLRKAQDVGAHRHQVYSAKPNAESELWKRAFWILVVQDRLISASLGRDCCSREEEFDINLPEEVDDEYWENEVHPELTFKQPKGKPSMIAAFVARIKLSQILAFALRTVGASDKSKCLLGLTGPDWKEKVVTELNSALTEWVKTIPEHLRWALKMDNKVFAKQSATLFTSYYLLQILIYRPFMPPPCSWAHTPCTHDHWHPHMNFPFPASALCTNAAHSFARIAEQLLAEPVLSDVPTLVAGAHVVGAIALMCVWELKGRERNATLADVKPLPTSAKPAVDGLLEDVQTMLTVLERVRKQWSHADKMIESLKESLPGPDADAHLQLISMSDSDRSSSVLSIPQILRSTVSQMANMSSSATSFVGSHDWATFPMETSYEPMNILDWTSLPLDTHPGYPLPGSKDYSSYRLENLSVPSQSYTAFSTMSWENLPVPLIQSQRNVRQHRSKAAHPSTMSTTQYALPASGTNDVYRHQFDTPDAFATVLGQQQQRKVADHHRDSGTRLGEPPTKRLRNSHSTLSHSSQAISPYMFLDPYSQIAGRRDISSQAVSHMRPYASPRFTHGTQSAQLTGYPTLPIYTSSPSMVQNSDSYMGGIEENFLLSPTNQIPDYQNHYDQWNMPATQGQSSYYLGQQNDYGLNF